ncbi:MAG: hypothetical protein A2W08_03130 [Candidatus Rokubacteria bacterium RBG_16_73_20]|nr:MAG: hypothetical protein A2W08_03130 [Candidatus Rokubacteria bacterium RBG_16_73_20]HBH01434.1 hypothetical protein [Candidatus Rokubacteria bacterium]
MDGPALAALAKALEGFAGRILDYALVLAAIGTVTMALLELLKAVGRARYVFNRRMVERWLGADPAVRREFLDLAAGGAAGAQALYDQPGEKLLGQMQAAVNVALDFPGVFPAYYGFLTAGAPTVGAEADDQRWKRFAPRIVEPVPPEGASREQFEADSRQSSQARARLGHLVTRRLDVFQTRLEYTWARLNQAVAVVGGGLLLYYLLPVAGGAGEVPWTTRLALAVVGGLVAPFAKDVVNALTGLRVRR